MYYSEEVFFHLYYLYSICIFPIVFEMDMNSIKIPINTVSHHPQNLEAMAYGIYRSNFTDTEKKRDMSYTLF